jgi:hypothetical protein
MIKKSLKIEPADSKKYQIKGDVKDEFGIMTGLIIKPSFKDRLWILLGYNIAVGITVVVDQPAKPVSTTHSCNLL